MKILQAIMSVFTTISVAITSFFGGLAASFLDSRTTLYTDYKKMTYEESLITDSERALARQWYEENILYAGTNGKKPAYDFKVNKIKMSLEMKKWKFEIGQTSKVGEVYRGGETAYITLTNEKRGLQARVEATFYEEMASCDWTVYIKNISDKNSGVITDFYAIDTVMDTGDAMLYFSNGGENDANAYTMKQMPVTSVKKEFSSTYGKSSDKDMPDFNILGENYGFVLGIGWTAQWSSSIRKSCRGVELKARQQELEAYLLPGEEIRCPMISLNFYEGGNELKGFNTLRKWLKNCCYNETLANNVPFTLSPSDIWNYTDEQLQYGTYIWHDAGWYEPIDNPEVYQKIQDQLGWSADIVPELIVGNWIPRTDDGENIAITAEKEVARGKKTLLWYEFERASEGTLLYNEGIKHDTWLVYHDPVNVLWNLADEDAYIYMRDFMIDSMKSNGADALRLDFNFLPQWFWQQADKNFYDNRHGICENHYVMNLYRLFDYMYENMDEYFFIDNCASGGKRIDMEMNRRSIPLWLSDYPCGWGNDATGEVSEDHKDIFEAMQNHSFGASFWLPNFGKGDFTHLRDVYAWGSSLAPLWRDRHDGLYRESRSYMDQNYYPLTYGGVDFTKYEAFQYDKDGLEGTALIYRRPETVEDSYLMKLNGLRPNETYVIYNSDDRSETYTATGEDLMNNGVSIPMPDARSYKVMMYGAVS